MPTGSLETIFAALQRAEVRYLVVGGVAVVLHGHPRFTADLDLVLALDPANVRAAVAALSELGYRPRAPVRAEDLAEPDQRADWIQNKASPAHWTTEVDLFVEEPFPFEAAYHRASWTDLGETRVPVANISDLVAMKRRARTPARPRGCAAPRRDHRGDRARQ